MAKKDSYPKALKHGEIRKIFENIFFVTGTTAMKAPAPMKFSRNMTIIREGEDLVLVNSVRLGEAGLAQLETLGKIRHVVRLAGFHGMDDPFYKNRYKAKVWSVNASYTTGFDDPPKPQDIYFDADVIIDDSTPLPLANSTLYEFKTSTPGEALLHLQANNGVVISGDCLQNWSEADKYFSWFSKIMMKKKGFIKPHNIGPGWLKIAAPEYQEIVNILELDFEHVLPAHGKPVIGGAKESYRPVINEKLV